MFEKEIGTRNESATRSPLSVKSKSIFKGMLTAAAGLALLLPFSAVTPCLAEEQETIKVESSEAAQPLNGDISSSDDRISNEGANNQQQPEESLSVADTASNSSSNSTTVWHSGWNGPDDNGDYRWGITDDELAKNTWLFINNHWYWFDSNGTMARGLVNVAGENYFFTESGNYAGAMATGWARADDGSWYWADASGALAGAGWRFIGGSWYWFGEDSRMATGWLETGTARYYLEPSGAMATNWAAVDGSWYWFGASGAMETGWLYEGGSWYWLDPSDGRMANDTWYDDGARSYWLGSTGAMARSIWVKFDGLWYWIGNDGSSVCGWEDLPGGRFFFTKQNDSTRYPAEFGLINVERK